MKRIALFLLLSIVFISCKKDQKRDSPPEVTGSCIDNDPKMILLPFRQIPGQDIDLKIWPDGWVALLLKGKDSVYVYDSEFNLKSLIHAPNIRGVKCLDDHKLLTVSNQANPLSHSDGSDLSAWIEMGRDANCERNFAYTQKGSIGYQALNSSTELRCFDQNGNLVFQLQLDGYASDEDPAEAIVQMDGDLYAAVAFEDTVRTRGVYDGMNTFQDTIIANSNDTELWLYRIDNQGSVLSKNIITNILAYYPRVNGKLVEGNGNLFYSSGKEVLRMKKDGSLLSQIFNPQAQCGEIIKQFLSYEGGAFVESIDLFGGQKYWYSLKGGTPDNFNFDQQSVLIGIDGSEVYVLQNNKIINSQTKDVIWDLSAYDPVLQAKFKVGCNGKLFGLGSKAKDGVDQFYLVKLN